MSTKPKILLVDDDIDILDILEYNLTNEGFEVKTVTNGYDALAMSTVFEPALIILDIMMPQIDGVQTATKLREIKKLNNCLIVFLTARNEEYSEVAAFNAGANDYIVKPIKMKALMSRIKALLKRGKDLPIENIDKIVVGALTINRKNHSVMVNNAPLVLAKKEFEVLFFLIQNKEKIYNRNELLHKIWGKESTVIERTVDVHIRKIREKIGENFIKTIKGVGYMFVNGIN
jgi:two-component system, OmpR family, alkaline phosphatase synthesis response regulator PhoP